MGVTRRKQEQRGEHAPQLWSVWVAAPIVLALGVAVACLVFGWLHAAAGCH